jgi:hypothetical protein
MKTYTCFCAQAYINQNFLNAYQSQKRFQQKVQKKRIVKFMLNIFFLLA